MKEEAEIAEEDAVKGKIEMEMGQNLCHYYGKPGHVIKFYRFRIKTDV